MLTLLSVKETPAGDSKKYVAFFSDGTSVKFGAKGYSDYTVHRDKKRRDRYRARHAKDNLNDLKSPGALSWYLLWGESTSLQQNIAAYKRRMANAHHSN